MDDKVYIFKTKNKNGWFGGPTKTLVLETHMLFLVGFLNPSLEDIRSLIQAWQPLRKIEKQLISTG